MRHSIAKLIGNTEKSYYRWKAEGRLIIILLEKYFSKEDIDEFIKTKKIARLDLNNNLTQEVAYKFYKIYFIHLLAEKNSFNSHIVRKYFINYLYYIKSHIHESKILWVDQNILLNYLQKFNSEYNEDIECTYRSIRTPMSVNIRTP